ncbi:hypothetical protein BD779DRAFT_1553646 [Infundibulicybe gibba]|nr:hypothetical protein BD779DRAFT_1553646 [Infundibulicybe gibba]
MIPCPGSPRGAPMDLVQQSASSSSSPPYSPTQPQTSKPRRIQIRPLVPNGSFVPPGYGKPLTRSRDSCRCLKRRKGDG